MALPLSRTRTLNLDTPFDPELGNEIQDQIVALASAQRVWYGWSDFILRSDVAAAGAPAQGIVNSGGSAGEATLSFSGLPVGTLISKIELLLWRDAAASAEISGVIHDFDGDQLHLATTTGDVSGFQVFDLGAIPEIEILDPSDFDNNAACSLDVSFPNTTAAHLKLLGAWLTVRRLTLGPA